jgi:hypothetical protein
MNVRARKIFTDVIKHSVRDKAGIVCGSQGKAVLMLS